MRAARPSRAGGYPGTGILSFFCGAGGLDLGFSEAGFVPLIAIDSSPACIQTHRANHPGCISWTDDLSVDASQICNRIVQRLGEQSSDVLPIGAIGGPPCQGFSQANVVSEINDPRNELVLAYAAILRELRVRVGLKFFVMENVAGLAMPRNAAMLERLRTAFSDAGFRTTEMILDAYDYGVPQRRRRLFMVGWANHSQDVVAYAPPSATQPGGTVGDTIRCLPSATFYSRALRPADIGYHENHWTMRPKSQRFQKQDFNKWRSFRRLEWNQPSPTVAYGNREIHVHPSGRRRLSILEAMLLQGFPESYCIKGNFSEQVRQVSNAVPPPLAKAIAASVRQHLVYHSD